jgi:hypothetical protein
MVRRWCPFWEPLCSALAATADAAGLVFNRHRLHVFGPNLQQIREPARPMPLKPAIPGRPARGAASGVTRGQPAILTPGSRSMVLSREWNRCEIPRSTLPARSLSPVFCLPETLPQQGRSSGGKRLFQNILSTMDRCHRNFSPSAEGKARSAMAWRPAPR